MSMETMKMMWTATVVSSRLIGRRSKAGNVYKRKDHSDDNKEEDDYEDNERVNGNRYVDEDTNEDVDEGGNYDNVVADDEGENVDENCNEDRLR